MLRELQTAADSPWKQRFRAPSIQVTWMAARAPTRGLAVGNQSGAMQYYTWDVPGGELRQLTQRPEGMPFPAGLSPDGRFIYYLDDKLGSEIGHYARLPYDGGEPQDLTPDLPPYSSWGFAHSRAGNRLAFMAAADGHFRIYTLAVGPDGAPGELRQLYHSQRLVNLAGPAHDGDVVVIASSERSGTLKFSLLAVDTTTGAVLGELWDGPDASHEFMVACPQPGNPRLLATTTRTGIETLLIWNPRTGERLDLTPEGLTGAVRAFDWSPDGEHILFRTFNQAVQQLYLYHLSSRTMTRLDYPAGTNTGPYFTPAGNEIVSHWQDSTQPTRVIALDARTGAMTRTLLTAGDAPPGRAWKSVTFPSSDGQMIQGWLGRPAGPGPFPTILETHGGPEAVEANLFAPGSQAWLDHGFAYLTINYRGSITFGREFHEKIWGHPGDWEVEDMAAARDWLVKEGIAAPDQILLTGWSYGGYLTLLALGKRPDLWAGGMAGIAIADWAVMYADSAETLRGYQLALFGGAPDEKPEQYRRSSPITYAEAVRAPVLIIQGRNDTRTPARPVEMYETRLKALGKPVEVHWFEAGHMGPFLQVEEGIAHRELMLRFAYRVLGQAADAPRL